MDAGMEAGFNAGTVCKRALAVKARTVPYLNAAPFGHMGLVNPIMCVLDACLHALGMHARTRCLLLAACSWATTLFCTILASNLLGLMPFNEAPTSGLGFATGLGVSVWATATALGLYKLGFKFPGHFIPGGRW